MIRLCSSSKTRANILKDSNIEFIQSKVDFNEDSLNIDDAKAFVYNASFGKFEDALARYGFEIPILVADTVVSADGKILRKANDRDEAKELLKLQSGNRVSIITCMIYKSLNSEMIDISSTDYQFSKFDEQDLKEYLNSQKWMGKAGAIMVEEFAKKYILEQRGLKSTAMGLTVEKLKGFLN